MENLTTFQQLLVFVFPPFFFLLGGLIGFMICDYLHTQRTIDKNNENKEEHF